MTITFEEIFRTGEPARDKYLARLFALLNEQIVHLSAGTRSTLRSGIAVPTRFLWAS